MTTFKEIVANDMRKSIQVPSIPKKAASELVADDMKLHQVQISLFSVEKYFKKQNEFIADDAYVSSASGSISFELVPRWTGQGFAFNVNIKSLKISATCEVETSSSGDFEPMDLDIEVPPENIEIEIKDGADKGINIVVDNVTVDFDNDGIPHATVEISK